jgi:hypothetical protein
MEATSAIRNLVRDYAAKHPGNTIAIKTDWKNAFNSALRQRVWETLQKLPGLSSMLKAFYVQYTEPSELLVYDRNRLVHKILSR